MRKILNQELGRPNNIENASKEKHNFCVVLDNVRSLSNVGSVFRTCDALGASHLYLCGITGTPPNRDLHKTALGSEDSVNWNYFENTVACIEFLKNKGYEIVLIEQIEPSIFLHKFSPIPSKKYAYVFGNEIDGISSELLSLADLAIEIPQFGTKHSINISVCAGMVLWNHVSKNL